MGNQEPGLMISSCWGVLFIVCFLCLFCFGVFLLLHNFNLITYPMAEKKIGEGFMMAVKMVLILVTDLPVAPS